MNIELSDDQINKIIIQELKDVLRWGKEDLSDYTDKELEAVKVVLGIYLSESEMIKFENELSLL